MLRWFFAAAIMTGVLLWAGMALDPRNQGLSSVAQGIAGVATVVALFIAVGVYFLERKDKPSITFTVDAARALLSQPGAARSGARRNVLLGIRVLLTNNGARQVEMKCIALALFRPGRADRVTRNPGAPEEMRLEPVAEPIPYDRPNGRGGAHDRDVAQINACIDKDLDRIRRRSGNRDLPRESVRPLFMWSPLRLEPRDVDDRYFEIQASCADPFLRVMVKMRVDPESEVYETKAIIPLAEICSGAESGVATPMASGGQPPA
ncbi:MAG TPA: hypothetical protein VEW04_11190 [Allosphingosinicella sp.]|nr:hypothetical protein [Allosphingosinicella sp.]